MEIVITHTIHPEVMALLKSFIAPNSGGQVAKEVAAPVTEVIEPAKTKTVAPKVETPKEEAQTPEATTNGTEKKLEFTDLRQLYLTKKDEGKQEKVKALLTEYGVEKLSAIKPEQFNEVYDKIKAL